jgi:hypothetical protein
MAWKMRSAQRTFLARRRYRIMTDITIPRRNLLLASMLATLAAGESEAGTLDPSETMVTLPDTIPWKERKNFPPNSVASAMLHGGLEKPGIYYELIKWYPGYMSAPHTYITDRLCVVVSGTWWVNSGVDFDPARCEPVPAGTFVRRVAHTPHYDGVVATGKEPAVIAICGIGPAGMQYVDPNRPGWRKA